MWETCIIKSRVNAKKIELPKLNGESFRPQMMREEIVRESGNFFAAKDSRLWGRRKALFAVCVKLNWARKIIDLNDE